MKLTDIFKSKQTRMLQRELAQMVVGYQPVFNTYTGGVYEMALTVSCIDAFARHASKATPIIKGAAYQNLSKRWKISMNKYMTTSQFMYRLATIYECEHNVFIIPVYDPYPVIVGLYPVSTQGSQLVLVNGEIVLKYKENNETKAIPYKEVAHIKSHHYKSEYMGEGNKALQPTLELMDTQNQGIINGIKNSAAIRFIVKLATMLKPEHIATERQRIINDSLSVTNQSGIMLFDEKVADVKQVDSKAQYLDADQQKIINESVYGFFGTNENILQNKFDEIGWASYYEGKVEPFLNQVGQALTQILFTSKELAFENYVYFEGIRLQHADIKTKWTVGAEGLDRGVFTINEVRTMLNLPEIAGGDVRVIRRDYMNADETNKVTEPKEPEPKQPDEEDNDESENNDDNT